MMIKDIQKSRMNIFIYKFLSFFKIKLYNDYIYYNYEYYYIGVNYEKNIYDMYNIYYFYISI